MMRALFVLLLAMAMVAFRAPAAEADAALALRIRAEQERRRRDREQDQAAPLTFRAFIALVNPRYQFYRHCEELIAVLQRVADGEITRLMVFMPPRHSKSETVSRLFAAYYLYRYPDREVGVVSYAADLAYTLSRAARDLFTRGGGLLARSARSVKYWRTWREGGLWAAGLSGQATGKGYHLGIVDDPIKDAKEAHSPTMRARVIDWWNSVWTTRQAPLNAQIIVQTRWHEEDLGGYLLSLEADEPEGWYVVCMPAIAEELPPYPASCTVHPDWREAGAPLCPERYPLDKLHKLAGRITAYFFGALFQQRPRPRDGGLFATAAQIIDAMPAVGVRLRIRYWDKAGAREGKGDWTVGVLLAFLLDGRVVVEDVVRFQLGPAERNNRMRETAELDRARGRVTHYVEQPPGDGVEATQAIIRHLAGFAVFADPARGDKVERADGWAAQWQAGNVLLLWGAWNKAYIEEHRAFPYGRNDDQVDGSSGGYNKGAAAPVPSRPAAVGGDRGGTKQFQPR
jgi:predicted phage terminase large subunit-like protein